MADDFAIDSRSKYGEAQWEDGDEFATFIDALNRGVSVRTDSVPTETGAPADIRTDEAALSELRRIFANY